MEGGWLYCMKTLVQSIKADCDQLCTTKLEEYHSIANRVLTQKRLQQQGQDELLCKRKERDRISSLLNKLTPQLDKMEQDINELNLCLNAAQSHSIESCRQSEAIKQKLDGLTPEVIDMEHDKENKVKNFEKNFKDLMNVYKTYKTLLDMRVEWERPDVYKIWFSKSPKNKKPHMVLSSTDFKSWEVLEVCGDQNLKDQLNDDFVEHRNVQSILLKARQLSV